MAFVAEPGEILLLCRENDAPERLFVAGTARVGAGPDRVEVALLVSLETGRRRRLVARRGPPAGHDANGHATGITRPRPGPLS